MGQPIIRNMMLGGGRPHMNDTADPTVLDANTFPVLRNVDPFYRELRKRNGRIRVLAAPIAPSDQAVATVTTLIPYDITVSGTRYTGLLCSDGQYFWTITGTSGAAVNSAALTIGGAKYSSGTAGTTWRGVCRGAYMYLVNGKDKPLCLYYSSGLKLFQAGVEPPDTDGTIANNNNGSGNLAAGIYYVRWAYKNSTTGRKSNLSAPTSAGDDIGTVKVTVTNDNLIVTGISAPSQAGVDRLLIYRTPNSATAAEQTDLYLDAEVTLTSGDVTWNQKTGATAGGTGGAGLTDDTLVEAESAWTDFELQLTERDVPPCCTHIELYGNRAWYGGAGTGSVAPYDNAPADRIFFSNADVPDYVAYTDQQSDFYDSTTLPTGGGVVGLCTTGDRLLALCADECFETIGNAPQFYTADIGRGVGAIAADGQVGVEGIAFFASRSGIYVHAMGQSGASSLTRDALDNLWASLTTAYLSSINAVYYAAKSQVWFFLNLASSDGAVLVWQIAGDESGWSVYDGFFYIITACAARTVHENTTTQYLYCIDTYNHLYLCDYGTNDAALDLAATAALTGSKRNGTVSHTNTANTLKDTTATFYTTGSGLAGAPIWKRSTTGANPELRYITGNTATVLAVSSNWTNAPVVGDKYEIGGIGYRIVGPAAIAAQQGDGFHVVNAERLHLQIERDGYEGSDTAYAYLLVDGATSITTGDTKKTFELGDADNIGNWPSVAFGGDDEKGNGTVQACIENYQTERAVRIRKMILVYKAFDISVGVQSM